MQKSRYRGTSGSLPPRATCETVPKHLRYPQHPAVRVFDCTEPMDPVTTIDNLPECGRLLRQIKIEIKEMEEAALNARTMDIEELKKAIRGHRAGRKRLVQQLGQLLEEQKIALNIHVLSGDDFPIRVCPWQSIKGVKMTIIQHPRMQTLVAGLAQIQLVPLGRHPELMADDREVDDYQLRDGDAVQLVLVV